MGRQVGADFLPGDAAVAGAMEVLRAVIDGVRREGRNLHRRHALKAVHQTIATIAIQRFPAHPVALLIAGIDIQPRELPFAAAINDCGLSLSGMMGPVSHPGPVR